MSANRDAKKVKRKLSITIPRLSRLIPTHRRDHPHHHLARKKPNSKRNERPANDQDRPRIHRLTRTIKLTRKRAKKDVRLVASAKLADLRRILRGRVHVLEAEADRHRFHAVILVGREAVVAAATTTMDTMHAAEATTMDSHRTLGVAMAEAVVVTAVARRIMAAAVEVAIVIRAKIERIPLVPQCWVVLVCRIERLSLNCETRLRRMARWTK
mmetsp:Transcript_14717/g.22139  ORF Transcript_14717/g.22139 Transcript_14717/m.22139 type:complete len:213 (-) Transcript_14717:1442-2080(-)